MSAKEDFMGNWENALTAAADAFANHVDTIVENFSEAMGGVYKNLEQLQEAFDRQTEVNDRYLQQYEKTYEINKLNRSIQDNIDKTDNVASQKELRKLQQELLAMQKDGVNVS
jgi:predicted  nucleic acid-binding Zn-ribbon protein